MRRASAGRLAALCLALAVAIPGCSSTESSRWGKGEWAESSLAAASDRVLWQVTLLSLEKAGFAPGTEMDPVELEARSSWRMSLAPFKGDGFREQAIVRYERLGGGRYEVGVRVRRERNDAMDNPLDAARAEWVEEPDNLERARIVLQFVRSFLGEEAIEVAPRQSETHGITGKNRP
jgi:hypothetical protein